jgi:hypothetical protein
VKDIIDAAKGEIIAISKSAPSINILGSQKFITRRMRSTEKRGQKALKKEKLAQGAKV